MVLGLTLLTEPNLSLATTQQVDDLKNKKSTKKKNWPLTQDGQGSNLTALTLATTCQFVAKILKEQYKNK